MLLEGLAALARDRCGPTRSQDACGAGLSPRPCRPPNPVEWLAAFLMKHKDRAMEGKRAASLPAPGRCRTARLTRVALLVCWWCTAAAPATAAAEEQEATK